MKYEKKIVAWVGAIAENDSGEMLLLKRVKTSSVNPGYWQLPGGKMEWGETTLETLQREMFEETGMNLKNPVLLDAQTVHATAKMRKMDYHVLMLVYKGRLSGEKVKISEEHDAFKWIPVNALAKEKFDLDAKRLIRLCKQK